VNRVICNEQEPHYLSDYIQGAENIYHGRWCIRYFRPSACVIFSSSPFWPMSTNHSDCR